MVRIPYGSVIFVLIVSVFFVGTVVVTHNMLTAPYPGHNDFMSRWEGARSFWVDHLNPYGDQASLNIQKRIYGRPAEGTEDPGLFVYPMYTAVLIWPLVYMDYAWASAIWMVLLATLLIGSVFILLDLFRWRIASWVLGILCIWVFLFYYSARGLILGQVGVVVYFLELVALWGLVKRRDNLAGVALAISTIKPQMGFLIVPFFLLWGLRYGRWKFIVIFSVSMLILLITSFVLVPSWLGDWLAQVGQYPSYTAVAYKALGSPVWILSSYYLNLGGWAELLISGLLVVMLLVTWYWVLRGHPNYFIWVWVMTVTVTHMIASRTATPHYVVFIIPLMFYFSMIAQRNRRRGNLWIVLILLALLVLPWAHFLLTVDKNLEHISVFVPLPFIMFFMLWYTRRLWWNNAPTMRSN